MHECTSIIMNSFHLFLIFSLYVYMLLSFLIKGSFKNYVHCGGGRTPSKANENEQGEGVQVYLFVHSVKKIA